MVSNVIFEKATSGLFPNRAYVSHKNDRPDLTQKVLWSSKGLVVNLSIFFWLLQIRGRPEASIAAILRQSAGYISTF